MRIAIKVKSVQDGKTVAWNGDVKNVLDYCKKIMIHKVHEETQRKAESTFYFVKLRVPSWTLISFDSL